MKNLTYKLDGFSRFELFPNATNIGLENAFSIYGILVLPILMGSITLYHVFDIRGIHFGATFGLFLLVILNIYIFYERVNHRDKVVKLIIDECYVQMIAKNTMQFQAHIQEVSIENIRCGDENYPAIKLINEQLEYIVIGVRAAIPQHHAETQYPLTQPDYWIKNKKRWYKLQALLNQ